MTDEAWLGILRTLSQIDGIDPVALRQAMAAVLQRADDEGGSAAFARHVALCIADAPDVMQALRDLHVEDLALAFACARGDAARIAAFRERFAGDVERIVGKYPVLASERADVVQSLFERLLVPREHAPPRIAEYRGRGPLQGWVRVSALRVAMQASQARAGEPQTLGHDAGDGVMDGQASLASIEDRYVRQAYAGVVRASVETAFSELSEQERNVLRLHVVHGLTIDQIAPSFGVHRATAARWLERARKRLGTVARERLIAQHGIAPSDVHSVMRCVQSEVELSIGRLLGP